MQQPYSLAPLAVLLGWLVGSTCNTADPSSSPAAVERDLLPRVRPRYPLVRIMRHREAQLRMGWTDPEVVEGTTFSVIVIEFNDHQSNLFRRANRVKTFSPSGSYVVSVQFGCPFPYATWNETFEGPFNVRHPEGVDRRIRIVHVSDMVEGDGVLNEHQVRSTVGYYMRVRNVHEP